MESAQIMSLTTSLNKAKGYFALRLIFFLFLGASKRSSFPFGALRVHVVHELLISHFHSLFLILFLLFFLFSLALPFGFAR